MDKIKRLQELIDSSQKIVFFGGAGVSTESGIPDFRSQDGLYHTKYSYPPEQILSHDFFVNDPREFYRFYFDKMIYSQAKPNAAHKKLAEMEKFGSLTGVITQNIDGLHQAAGSQNVQELHGSVHRHYCTKCAAFHTLNAVFEKYEQYGLPLCECGGLIKPDVVLYGESLDQMTVINSVNMLRKADLVIVGGTSLNVYPAAGLLEYFRGKARVLINKSPTPFDREADLTLNMPIGEVMSQIEVVK